MTERAKQLHATADAQIAELADAIKTLDEAAWRLPCAGREKLGDGTVGAFAQHTAQNYERIGTFVVTADRLSTGHRISRGGAHRIPRFVRALGHRAPEQSQHRPVNHGHDQPYTAESNTRADIVEQLSVARRELSRIAELSDRQLDGVPPKDSFRFCDGQRTLEQVLLGLLKHQDHQVQTIRAALA